MFMSGFAISKGLCGVLFLGYLLVLISPWTLNYLALVPAKTFPFVWNIITAGYIEQSISELISSILGLLLCGKFLEPMWTSREFLKFIIFVNTTTLLGVYLTAVAIFHMTKAETLLYVPLSGFHGVLAGFLVAMKQIAPDQDIEVFGCFHLRSEWLPSFFIFMSIFISIITLEPMQHLSFVLYGTYWGWVYLRYIQRLPESNIPGTPGGDQFEFSAFFPRFIRERACAPEETLHKSRNDGASEDHASSIV
uniref:Rhomboid-like protein 19 n=1 Tax=Elaeis guineensis var. tenera TaxID=51953 RepID=A0A8N4F5A0_ELAGV|nr:rhomboid-like protein 19 [Elaeis guineensis]